MRIIINDIGSGKCLCNKRYPDEFIAVKGMEEENGEISYGGSRIVYSESWFEGMRIISAEVDSKDKRILQFETDSAFYMMMFCTEGHLRYTALSMDIVIQANHCVFIHVPKHITTCEIPQSGKVICIQLTEKCYKRLTNNEETYSVTGFEPVLKTPPAMQMILKSIGECTHSEFIRRIFLETGVLQLLLLQLQQLPEKHKLGGSSLKNHDIEKIQYAKLLIEEDISNPCSLIELAHKAGLNDFKLKKGFKELYGTTVFGYLHEIRMEKAKKMLSEEKKSVNETAHEVGYKNPHHFSAAFKKRFGILPGLLNR